MALPTSKTELKSWILRELGEPVIKVNVAPIQIDDAIDDAMQFWREYHEAGQQRTYYKVQLTQQDIDNGYVTLPDNVFSVTKMIHPNAFGMISSSSDNFMSFQYQFMQASVWDLMQFGNASGFFIANQYLTELDRLFGPYPLYRYRYHTGKLEFDFESEKVFAEGAWLVCECYAYLDPSEYSKLWSDRWLRKLAVAYVRKKWGDNLRKFQGFQLPAGMTMNGDGIYQQAVDEITQYEQEIRNHMEPLGFIVA